jgi:predicted ATP-dependent endonuclease of OLD family
LENRSTGLQWFLSFYLVFLVESTETHKDAILLLDEAGLSLHAIAQQDLSKFFESLSLTNQIIYTTHSPFLVDSDHLDRVKAVYVDAQGATKVSADLRASERNPAQSQSIYPVHAALGLSVSTILLQGCQSIIVEGTSDQFYLSAIKNYLISKGSITPKRELLFVPAGGVKGITIMVPVSWTGG